MSLKYIMERTRNIDLISFKASKIAPFYKLYTRISHFGSLSFMQMEFLIAVIKEFDFFHSWTPSEESKLAQSSLSFNLEQLSELNNHIWRWHCFNVPKATWLLQ